MKLKDYFTASVKLVLIALFFQVKECDTAERKYYRKLLEDLFQNYRSDMRPVNNTNDAVTVNFSVFLSHILKLDERNQILTAYLWLRQEWTDVSLAWNPEKYDKLTNIRVSPKKIWLPDIVLYNNADATFTRNLQTNVVVTPNGKVRWDQPAITRASCSMDVSYFPFDTQSCVFTFGSWTFYLEHLNIVPTEKEGGMDDFVEDVEWKVTGMPITRLVKNYSCCSEPYPVIVVNLELTRKSYYYIYNLLIPCIVISVLSPLAFYLPAESGEKVSLGITTLLAMTVFQLLVAQNMPPSEQIPLLGKYYITIMALMSLSTAMTIFVQKIHFCGPHPPAVPRWMKKYILHYLARLLDIDVYAENSTLPNSHAVTKSIDVTKSDDADTKERTSDTKTCEEKKSLLNYQRHRGSHLFGSKTEIKKSPIVGIQSNGSYVGFHKYQLPSAANDLVKRHKQIVPVFAGSNSTCPRNFTGFDRSESNWSTLPNYKINEPYQTNFGIGPIIPTNRNYGPVARPTAQLRKGYSQQFARPNSSRCATPTCATQYVRDSLDNRRQSLLVMNAVTRTADYSDDTEISAVTTTHTESPRIFDKGYDTTFMDYAFKTGTSRGMSDSENVFHYGRSKMQPNVTVTVHSQCNASNPVSSHSESPNPGNNSKLEQPKAESDGKISRESSFQSDMKRSRSSSPPAVARKDVENTTALTIHRDNGTQTSPSGQSSSISDNRMREVLSDNVALIADHFRKQKTIADRIDEWKSVSKVLDRALMWIFAIIQLVFTTLILCKIL